MSRPSLRSPRVARADRLVVFACCALAGCWERRASPDQAPASSGGLVPAAPGAIGAYAIEERKPPAADAGLSQPRPPTPIPPPARESDAGAIAL